MGSGPPRLVRPSPNGAPPRRNRPEWYAAEGCEGRTAQLARGERSPLATSLVADRCTHRRPVPPETPENPPLHQIGNKNRPPKVELSILNKRVVNLTQ